VLALVALFVLLSLFYMRSTPPFEGPDEAQHFAYVTWLAEGRGFPPQGEAAWKTALEQEASQPPFYYLLAAIPARLIDLDQPAATYRPNPHFPAPLDREVWDNDNRAIHYPEDAHPLTGGWLALYLARGVTALFGVLLTVAVYGLARTLLPQVPAVAWAAALLVAVIPQVLFVSSVVSNDIPAAALSTLTLWLLARLLQQGPSRGRAIALGIAFGLAALTKASTLVLALPLALGIGWLWRTGRYDLGIVMRAAFWTALGALATAGWWFLRSWYLYGSPLGLATHEAAPWAVANAAVLPSPVARWSDTLRSFWAAFGWGTIRPPGWVYLVLLALMVIAGLGLAVAVWRWWRTPGRALDRRGFLLLLLALTVFAVAFMLEIWMQRVKAAHGRLLFPAVAALVILLVLGWRVIDLRLPFLAIGFVAAIGVSAPFLILQPAFSPPQLLTPAEAETLPSPLGWRFGPAPDRPVAELLNVSVAAESVPAGSVLPVKVCWRALKPAATDYSVLLHLVGPQNQVIASRRSYPGMGHYPTSRWQTNAVFCDQMHMQVEAERVPQTLRYRLEVALIDEHSGERLPAYTAEGQPLTITFADEVVVRTEGERRAAPQAAEPFQLLAQEVPTLWRTGEEYTIELHWGVTRPVTDNYQVFVHLRDPDSGENLAQADGPPLDGWYPTSWWTAGEVVAEERVFPVPADLPPGRYRLIVGFYDLQNGERIGPENDLGLVTVQP
jgi:4-amino-4-deoxy-L-arabinose transferase-like glycosyltransferase